MARIILDIANKTPEEIKAILNEFCDNSKDIVTIRCIDYENTNQFYSSEDIEKGKTNFFTLFQLAHHESTCDDENDSTDINYSRTFRKLTELVYKQVLEVIERQGIYDAKLQRKKLAFTTSDWYNYLVSNGEEVEALKNGDYTDLEEVPVNDLIEFLDDMKLSIENSRTPISIVSLSKLLVNLKKNHGKITISESAESDSWGVRFINEFENDCLICGYYGGSTQLFNFQTDTSENVSALINWLDELFPSSEVYIDTSDLNKLLKIKK